MRNHTATMAAAMSPAMMPSRRYRDRESMRDLLSSTPSSGRHSADPRGSLVYHQPGARANEPCAGAPALTKRLARLRGQAHDHLAHVVAGEEAEEGLGGVLDTLHDGLVPLDTPGLEPAAHLGEKLGIEAQVVGDDEALHEDAIADHGKEIARAGIRRIEVVLRDHAAEGDAGEGIDQAQHHVEERAAH